MNTAQPFKVACVQNCAENDMMKNIIETDGMVHSAVSAGARMVCMPEYFACIETSDEMTLRSAVEENNHPALSHFRTLASDLGVWLLLGSLAIRISETRVNNRSYLISGKGEIIARYNKMHLFDVSLKGGESYSESATVQPGQHAVVARTPWGKLGMSICYDLRFAYLYRAMAQAGAHFISVPAAFTQTTGEVHWHTLLRARAIETGCYIIAPDQCGVRSTGRATYGHSLVVAPWGEIIADGGTEPGFTIAEIDPERVAHARAMIPALQHDRRVGFVKQFP